MKYLMILLVGVCLLFASVPAVADQAEDEAAIRKVVEQWYATANSHDAKAMIALCDDNFENWVGTRRGRAALEKRWTELFEGRFKDVEYKQYEEIGIRFITAAVAVYKDRYDFSGALDADGKTQPPSKWLNAHVLVKKNGKWLYAAFHQRRIEE